MAGISVFSSLDEAEAAGFTFFLKAADAIIVQRTNGHFRALAVVDPNALAPTALVRS